MELTFESEVAASPGQAWAHVTSFKGISQETWPYLRMTVPKGIEGLGDLELMPGRPLFRSRLFVFGIIPAGRMLLTLVEIEDGVGFVEHSPMTGMRLWRHERRIVPVDRGCIIRDHLVFEPLWARSIASWFVRKLFEHRHAVLRRRLGAASNA